MNLQAEEPSPEVREESDTPQLASPSPAKKTVRVVKKKVVKKVVTRLVGKGSAGSSTTQSDARPTSNSNLAVSALEGVVVSVLVEKVENPNPLDGAVISVSDHEIERPSTAVSVAMEGVAVLGSKYADENPKPNSEIRSEAAVMIPMEGPVLNLVGNAIENPPISDLEDVNVGSIKDQKGESDNGDMNPRDGMKEEVENCDGGGSKEVAKVDCTVVLSEEMEALERQKRRKTEIFIGGLDNSATEEDIRKAFEEVGEAWEVRLMMNSKTGKNKGYAFLRFALASDAKKALENYPKVEVIKLFQEIGIDKIDKVTVMVDPGNIDRNRGFAFVERESNKDAQSAFKKLQKKEVFGKHQNIKVAWAEPLNEPDENEMLKVKMKVSLSKPIPKGKQSKQRLPDSLSKDTSNQKPKAAKCSGHNYGDVEPNFPINKGKSIENIYDEKIVMGQSSTNAELVQLLREQASWRQPQKGLASSTLEYPYTLAGSKRPNAVLGDDPLYSDPRVRT